MENEIVIAFYRVHHTNFRNAKGCGAVYASSSDITGGYTGLLDALDAGNTAIYAAGAEIIIAITNGDQSLFIDNVNEMVLPEFDMPEEFWKHAERAGVVETW